MDQELSSHLHNPNDEANSFEDRTHAFVIKIWLEELASGDDPPIWRGHITHAFTGKRQHMQSLQDVSDFIALYLVKWGINES